LEEYLEFLNNISTLLSDVRTMHSVSIAPAPCRQDSVRLALCSQDLRARAQAFVLMYGIILAIIWGWLFVNRVWGQTAVLLLGGLGVVLAKNNNSALAL